jgi:hypothetical protein
LRSVIVWVLFVFIVILYDVENDVIFIWGDERYFVLGVDGRVCGRSFILYEEVVVWESYF